MTSSSSSAEWASARGEKWRSQLAGLEGTIKPIDEPLITALALDAPCRIADVGCGGGATSSEILRRAPQGSIVHGFDISASVLEAARGRVRDHDHSIAFYLADVATQTPLEGAYDRLTSRFGIMFFEDPLHAFTNLAGWLVPQGRFAFAAWAALEDNAWMTTIREVVAGFVELPPVVPDAPGPFRYGRADDLLAILGKAGFAELEVRDFRGDLSVGGGLPPAAAARFALAAYSSFAELLAQAGDGMLESAQQALTTRFQRHQADGVVRLGARVHIFRGTRLGVLS
jgi:SAM-dependent methyltransferase